MPGSIVHLIVQQRLPELLRGQPHPGLAYGKLLDDDPCSPYAYFGSQGPDFLFFSLKEYGTPLDELTHFIFGVYDALSPLIDFYKDNIEPLMDDIEDAARRVDDVAFAGFFQRIGDTADTLTNTAITAAKRVLTSHFDLFYPFYPKLQQGVSEDQWYWFDFLHHRRTGHFCSQMWKLAKDAGDPDLQRYCLGYASHIGTDVAGHPFVNAIVGGPYRTHWHRHKYVEGWIDAYARNYYPDSRQTQTCLRLKQDDHYVSNNIAGSYYSRLCTFPNGRLPRKLAAMIEKALQLTYGGLSLHPVMLNARDLDDTYRLWLKWFEYVTRFSSLKPVPPPFPPGAQVGQLINDYISGLPAFPGAAGRPGGFSISGILTGLHAFLVWLTQAMAYTIGWIVSKARDIIQVLIQEGFALLTWLLYQIQKGVYEIYDHLRFGLVMGGYFFPEPQDLSKPFIGNACLNTTFVNFVSGITNNTHPFPLQQEMHGLVGTIEHHLFHPSFVPGTAEEGPRSEPAPAPFYGVFPEAFISRGFPYNPPNNPPIERLYDCIGPYGVGNSYTHTVDRATWSSAQFGSALHFSARLITQRMDKLPNFNLDSDRGYGWKTWKAQSPLEDNDPFNTQNAQVDYIDSDYTL